MKLQVQPGHYFNSSYDTKERFISYWHQINEIMLLKPRSVLEVGVGNGFLSNYLKIRTINITTLDIEYRLKPDIAGSILDMPIKAQSFNIVVAYEILEHIPYNNFVKALKELSRVSQKYIVISLPDITTVYRFNIELPRIRPIKKLIPHPFPRATNHIFDKQHYWEIGKVDYPLDRIKGDMRRIGLNIIKTYRIFEYYYHRFFILEKVDT